MNSGYYNGGTQNKGFPKKAIIIAVIAVLLLVVLLLVACVSIVLGIPSSKYKKATEALASGEYEVAGQMFEALGNYKDSSKMVKEVQYQKAVACIANNQFDEAHRIFIELGEYEDSATMAHEAQYQKAVFLLENKQYDDAHRILAELGNYGDSSTMAKEALYQKAVVALENGKYDEAVQAFASLGNYAASQTKLVTAKYEKAVKALQAEDFASAYVLLAEVGEYKDAAQKMTDCLALWLDRILSVRNLTEATEFKQTVKLSSKQYRTVYETVLKQTTKKGLLAYNASEASVVLAVLQTLPSDYENTSALTKLFSDVSSGQLFSFTNYIRNNKQFLRSAWSLQLVQDFLMSDEVVFYFLDGQWEGRGVYCDFYSLGAGSWWFETNVSVGSKPTGTETGDIEDLTFYWVDKNGEKLQAVLQFEIVDFDTMRVFSKKMNQVHHTLTRK